MLPSKLFAYTVMFSQYLVITLLEVVALNRCEFKNSPKIEYKHRHTPVISQFNNNNKGSTHETYLL